MVILERINKTLLVVLSYFQSKQLSIGDMVVLAQYLHPRLVLFTDEEERDQVIQKLINLVAQEGLVQDREAFYKAVIDREKIVSTGIGMGVAIPHAKIEKGDQFFIAIGVHKKQGIEWQSLDGSLVRLVFLVGGPADAQKKYLKILSHLTSLIKQGNVREEALKMKSPEQLVELFKKHDHLAQ